MAATIAAASAPAGARTTATTRQSTTVASPEGASERPPGLGMIPSVGHCSQRVVDAVTRQTSLLNADTLCLHENILDYAETLVATPPRRSAA